MQIIGRTSHWGQTDLAPGEKKRSGNSVPFRQADRTQKSAVPAAQNNTQKHLSSVAWNARQNDPADGEQESYVPSDEGMLELYLEQLEQMQAGNENAQSAQDDEIKALRIAHNIMRGMKVPAKDESFLLTKNFKLYMAAKNIASMKECKGTAKSVLDGSESTSLAASAGGNTAGSISASGIFGEGTFAGTADVGGSDMAAASTSSGNFQWNASGTKDSTSGIYSSSTTKFRKKRKKLHYNFKDVSAQIINARTSGNARQVLARAKQKTATLRRKLRVGDYDDELVMMAITHAEAMERVAKKKMKHLQEEERAERVGGLCAGDTDREDIREQQRQDEQMFMQMQSLFDSMDETMIDLSDSMIDLSDSMSELMDAFADMMQETLEEAGGLDELAEELLDSGEQTIDPDDLRQKKIKHRTEELRAIAEADAKYLKAFFEKLQRDQQAAAEGAAKVAEAMNGGDGMLMLAGAAMQTAPAQASSRADAGMNIVDTGSTGAAVPEVSAAAPAPNAAPAPGAVVDISIGE